MSQERERDWVSLEEESLMGEGGSSLMFIRKDKGWWRRLFSFGRNGASLRESDHERSRKLSA